jgi:hypothetical protein
LLNRRVQLRLDTGIVRYPDHYCDDNGKKIWDMVVKFLEEKRTGTIGESEFNLLPEAA